MAWADARILSTRTPLRRLGVREDRPPEATLGHPCCAVAAPTRDDPEHRCSLVVLVGLLVFIHEFGHFIVAKACGVGVPVFSIGFGRRVFGVEVGGTDYRLSASRSAGT